MLPKLGDNQMQTNNVFNPENIEVGDTVLLHDHHNDTYSQPMIVQSIGGRFGSKVYCQEAGREFNASCFKLVAKATKPDVGDWSPRS